VTGTGAAPAARAVAPSPAVAPPPGNPRFPLFDALRGLAVLAVLLFHVCLVTGSLVRPVLGNVVTQLGAQAPPLFFAISGFLLYRPWVAARAHQAPAPGMVRFWRRRALRILPAYWVALTVLAIFPGVQGPFSGDWWRYYGFLQLYSTETLNRGIPVAWTLCVEVSFYLLLPLWALGLRALWRGPDQRAWVPAELAALGLMAAAGAAVQAAAAHQTIPVHLGQTLLGQAIWMAVGMALAVVSVTTAGTPPGGVRRLVAAWPGACWAVAGAALVGLALLRNHPGGIYGIIAALNTPQPILRTLAEVALSGVLTTGMMLPAVFGDRGGGAPRRLLRWAPIAWLGVVSYGVYLWHLTLAELLALLDVPAQFRAPGLDLAGRLPNGATPALLILTLAGSCLLAWASYRWVELPFLRRKERARATR
jgi:peptidoglycan/LPS O-acetylase OafA/YrhL